MTPRKIMHDVVPKDKTIRNIPVPQRSNVAAGMQRNGHNGADKHTRRRSEETSKGKVLFTVGFAVLFAVVLLFFGFSTVFSGATVIVTPRFEQMNVDAQITAQAADRGIGQELVYRKQDIEKKAFQNIAASGEQHVERRASGTITIHNNYNTSPQRLIKNTRFEAPDGKIYRIDESITVPGQNTIGGEVIPGSVNAIIYADSAGEEYNTGIVRFTIPGFKDDPGRFSGFYAKSVTPITGGFVGTENIVEESVKKDAVAALDARLRSEAFEELEKQTPEGFIFRSTLIAESFAPTAQASGSGKSTVRLERTLAATAYYLPKESLEEAVINAARPDAAAGEISVHDLGSVNLSLVSAEQNGTIAIGLSGMPTLVWRYNADQLRQDLAGRPKSTAAAVLTKYKHINETDVITSPFWKRTFPEDPERITVETTLD